MTPIGIITNCERHPRAYEAEVGSAGDSLSLADNNNNINVLEAPAI